MKSAISLSAPTPPPSTLYTDEIEVELNKIPATTPPFLRLLRFPFIVLRIAGFFPLESGIIRGKNLYSILVLTFIVCTNLYMFALNLAPSLAAMFSQWTVQVTIEFGISLYFCLCFTCLIFVVSIGYKEKLEHLSRLMTNATEQKGSENHFTAVEKKLYIMQTIIVIATVFNFIFYLCLITIPMLSEIMPDVVNSVANFFGDSIIGHIILLFFAPLEFLAVCQSALVYWACCKSLRVEFNQVNKDIIACDLHSNVRQFKETALKHSRLLKCLNYLHHEVALYVMCVFAFGSLLSTLFSYVILYNEANVWYRLISTYWLGLTAIITCILCLAAGGLHHSVKESKERACSKIAEGSKDSDVDKLAYNIANMLCRQSTLDNGITAFGFFTVSKGLLMTIYSFIATYVVILLQSPPSSKTDATNSTSSS